MVLREFREADAQEINRLAVTAFEEYSSNYSDWPALAAFLAKVVIEAPHAPTSAIVHGVLAALKGSIADCAWHVAKQQRYPQEFESQTTVDFGDEPQSEHHHCGQIG